MRRPEPEHKMMKILTLAIPLLALVACAHPSQFVSDIPMRPVGPYSKVGVQHTDSGFRMRVEYTEKNEAIYQVIENCENELISLAEQYAETFPRKIEPIQKSTIQVSINRLPAGVRGGFCKATVRAVWATETEPVQPG